MKLFSYASVQPPVSNITTEEVHDVSSDMKTLSIQVDSYLSVGLAKGVLGFVGFNLKQYK